MAGSGYKEAITKAEKCKESAKQYRKEAAAIREAQNKVCRENGYPERTMPFYSKDCDNDIDMEVKARLNDAEEQEKKAEKIIADIQKKAKEARKELQNLKDAKPHTAAYNFADGDSYRKALEKAKEEAKKYREPPSHDDDCCVM